MAGRGRGLRRFGAHVLSLALVTVGLQVLAAGSALAVDPGDVSVDLVAAGPFTYDHDTLAGSGNLPRYGSRQISRTNGVVESLEGGDFACGDLVLFFARIDIDAGATGSGTVELDMSFLTEPTGQPGAGFDDIVNSTAGISLKDDAAGGANDRDGDESVTLINEQNGQLGGHAAREGTLRVTGLEAGETVVVQVAGHLGCLPSSSPTGNLQVAVIDGRVDGTRFPVGNQTIPFKKIEDLAQPGIDVTKSCPATGLVGEAITYQITVSNTGNEGLVNIAVQDTILGNLSGSFADSLAAGDSETQSFRYTIRASDPNPLVNTVTVNAVGAQSATAVTDTAQCSTTPLQPELGVAVSIVKDNDANGDGIFTNREEARREGLDVPFSLVITNVGEDSFTITRLTDSFEQTVVDLLLAKCSNLDGVTLAPGESVECTFTISNYSPPSRTDLENTARVCVEQVGGDDTDCAQDPSIVTSAVVLGRTVTPVPTRTAPGGIAFTGPGDRTLRFGALAIALLVIGSGLLWAGYRRRGEAES